MNRLRALFFLVFIFTGVNSEKDPEKELRKLPKFYHLDDYERCLERTDGVYCLGIFEIYSDGKSSPLFDLVQEKAQDISLYNRSLLHRGYCLPTRCPSSEANATARFERCVNAWARGHSLRARLRTLHYCRAHGQPRPREPDTADLPHRVLLYFVCIMLLMAVIGTVYDFYFSKEERKTSLLMAFSLRTNWNYLTLNYEEVDPRRELSVFHAIRFVLGMGMMYWHAILLTSASYQLSPRFMEKFLLSATRYFLGTGMTFTLTYIFMSNFLSSYNILLLSEKINISWKLYPLFLLKRILRMYPVYILLNGFAATWWESFGDGPFWPLFVARESEACRNKFWLMSAFLQNIIDKKLICLIQTWIIAVDMQLYVFTLFLTLLLVNRRQYAVRVLSALFVGATAFVTYKSFELDLLPAYVYISPEMISTLTDSTECFFNLFTQPITGVMIAIAGTMVAFLYMDHQDRGIKINTSKFLLLLNYLASASVFIWCYLGYKYFRHYDKWTQHIMVVIERLVGAFLSGLSVYLGIYREGPLYRLGQWRSLRILSKLSFSVSLVHWFINIMVVTSRWNLHHASASSILLDTIGVYVLSHLVAIPVVLFVEFPLQKFLDRLINMVGRRWLSPIKKKTS